MSLRIHALLHNDINVLGSIADWSTRHGHQISTTRLYEDEPLPTLASFDWLVIMGGPMGVYETDTHPWLPTEKRFVTKAISAGKTIIGMCLGAQLIAECLGAKVAPAGIKEIGWLPVHLTPAGQRHPLLQGLPSEFMTFQWHGDGFECPDGAIPTATSPHWQHQGFIHQTALHQQLGSWLIGWQCHFEVTTDSLDQMVNEGTGISEADIEAYPNSVQSPAQILADKAVYAKANNRYFDLILDRLAEGVSNSVFDDS